MQHLQGRALLSEMHKLPAGGMQQPASGEAAAKWKFLDEGKPRKVPVRLFGAESSSLRLVFIHLKNSRSTSDIARQTCAAACCAVKFVRKQVHLHLWLCC